MTGTPSPRSATASPAATIRESRREFLERSLSLLWPGDHRVTACGRRRQRGSLQFVLLPNGREPKAVIPRTPNVAAAAALAGYKASATSRMRAQLRMFSLGARLGAAGLCPDQVCVSSTGQSGRADIDAYLGTALGEPVAIALQIGPPRANRKPVLQLISDEGETLAFAKVGVSPLTEDLVRGEAETLRRLGACHFTTLKVPRLLHHGRFEGHQVAVQSALSGRASRDDENAVLSAMVELASLDATNLQIAAATSYWRRLQDKVAQLPASTSAAAVQQACRTLTELAGSQRIRLGAWHGDWTPWNMAVTGSQVAVWDWERFEPQVPRGFDALHHHLQGSIIRRKGDPEASARSLLADAPRLLAPFGVSDTAVDFTTLAYLVGLATRYLSDDMAGAGGRLGSVERWLLPVLGDRLAQQSGVRAR